MFISFLLPYIERGDGPLYHWVMLLQLASLPPDDLALVADQRYWAAGMPAGQEVEHFGFRYRVPRAEVWQGIPKYTIPATAFEPLDRRSGSMLDALRILLTEDYEPLRRCVEEILGDVCRAQKPEAVLTWCHAPSVKQAAARWGIPVIHNELGPLRPPLYENTIYFDFAGVNGFTSAEQQMHAFVREAERSRRFEPLDLSALRALLILDPAKRGRESAGTRYKCGAALQVEDDSNLVAFSNRMTNIDLIFAARKGVGANEVLIRQHPRGHARYSETLGAIDRSPDAIEFLLKCDTVFTINSSVAFECLLQGKPVHVLGDSPAAALSNERLAKVPDTTRLLWLNWLFLGYLVPARLLFDADYYRWRLSGPTLREVYDHHLSFYRRRRAELGEAAQR